MRLVLLLALLASPLAAQDRIIPWTLPADSRCEVNYNPRPADSCTLAAVALVRQRAINALAQGIVLQDPSLTREQAVAALNAPLWVYYRKSFIFVAEGWDGGAGGTVYNICAAGVTWTNDRIEVSLSDDSNGRILRLVMWEASNAMLGRGLLTWPDGSGGWGDGPIVQMLADPRGFSCTAPATPYSEPLPLVTR